MWVSVAEHLPDDSRKVLITDGVNVSAAHYFVRSRDPRTGETFGPEWVNQFERLTGGYVEAPTHWAEISFLLALLAEAPPAGA